MVVVLDRTARIAPIDLQGWARIATNARKVATLALVELPDDRPLEFPMGAAECDRVFAATHVLFHEIERSAVPEFTDRRDVQ